LTITIAWIRQNKKTAELLVASDSRLRAHGAIDQSQKIFRMERGDCCLGFCGDTQIAYPLFAQVGAMLNNHLTTRTRGKDITDVTGNIKLLLNNLVSSWDLPTSEKKKELQSTKILFAGWSWKLKIFRIGVFKAKDGVFGFHLEKSTLPHPWGERYRSLIFIGDYKKEYMAALEQVLAGRHGKPSTKRESKKIIDFDYEPVEALADLLRNAKDDIAFKDIGGAPQILKIYSYGNNLPIVVRDFDSNHFLLGRKLFEWEKTNFPVIDLGRDPPVIHYPMAAIPRPADLSGGSRFENDELESFAGGDNLES
jgi:hypothetical protein